MVLPQNHGFFILRHKHCFASFYKIGSTKQSHLKNMVPTQQKDLKNKKDLGKTANTLT